MEWTLEAVVKKLEEIKAKGYIGIPEGVHRTDDGIVGQLLEREFEVPENNISLRDLGSFELKGLRRTSSNITLSHKRPVIGLSPIEIFDRFGYVRASNRNPNQLKKKLFVTVNGKKPNPQGLLLKSISTTHLNLVYKHNGVEEHLSQWDLTGPLQKMDQIILGLARTTGKTNAKDETFYYEKAMLLDGLRPLDELIDEGLLVVDFCIDQPLHPDGSPQKGAHDRGPHIRSYVSKLARVYTRVEQLL